MKHPLLSWRSYVYVHHIDSVCTYKLFSSIFKTGLTLKCRIALGLDFSDLTHLCFSVALYMYILRLYSTCCKPRFLRSNWQSSHRFLLQSLRPLNQSECGLKLKQLIFNIRNNFQRKMSEVNVKELGRYKGSIDITTVTFFKTFF